jgi:hypothetical protein
MRPTLDPYYNGDPLPHESWMWRNLDTILATIALIGLVLAAGVKAGG